DLIEKGLKEYFPKKNKYPETIIKAMSHSLFNGGKRFRPSLTILTAKSFGKTGNDVLPIACSFEYIHTYSLIHDDLPAIDNDKMRRGKPTCHIKFGEDIAILAGDGLFAEAFYILSTKQKCEAKILIKVISEISEATSVRGMVGGQTLDVLATKKKLSPDELLLIHRKKTGSLITAAAKCGAIVAGADEKDIQKVTDYARHIGLAFQIIDDILDLKGDEEFLGKPVGSDLRNKKPSAVSVFGIKKAKTIADSEIEKAKEIIKKISGNPEGLIKIADFVNKRTY
ncbi:MAG: polyprenyl synthetase family protein, partial [Actinomycetia bacterium]|nr:polyprenyl synthetase family protein [Actinomycetes bacterium]